jgi:hypothetical protein
MEMISSRNSVTDLLTDTSSSTAGMMRTATTVSMEHAVPELRTTPEVRCVFFSTNLLFYHSLGGGKI